MAQKSSPRRDIVVIGASAGGVQALRDLVEKLPRDLQAAVFVVLHVPPNAVSHLPEILTKCGHLEAIHPMDGETIMQGRIYVAPPDRHLLLEGDHVLVKKGPKENRFRPSVDALFRSAAYVFGGRVIGIVLSGALGDGSSGLWTVKRRGGIAIVQAPEEADFSAMPESALDQVHVDYALPAAGIGELLRTLVAHPAPREPDFDQNERERLVVEICVASERHPSSRELLDLGQITPFSCPECHAPLVRVQEGQRFRYRCHIGHGFTTTALLAAINDEHEEKLWQAIRSFEASAMLLENLGRDFQIAHQLETARLLASQAAETRGRSRALHEMLQQITSRIEGPEHLPAHRGSGSTIHRMVSSPAAQPA